MGGVSEVYQKTESVFSLQNSIKGGKMKASGENFHLSKWFLDFTSDNGEAMIFYAAKLTWHGWSITYSSWLAYDPIAGVSLKSSIRNVQMPRLSADIVTWSDLKFGISGRWKSMAAMLQTRIFETEDGYVEWTCYQPASKVNLCIKEKLLEGIGYVEKLTLTIPPWKIPMDELRWGRFISNDNKLVWIELREKVLQQWVWLNGERLNTCIVEDDQINIPEKNMVLDLNREVVLESEKKIVSLAEKFIRYIPGINKLIPMKFLMADEFKWLSKAVLKIDSKTINTAYAIHELVNFKA